MRYIWLQLHMLMSIVRIADFVSEQIRRYIVSHGPEEERYIVNNLDAVLGPSFKLATCRTQ